MTLGDQSPTPWKWRPRTLSLLATILAVAMVSLAPQSAQAQSADEPLISSGAVPAESGFAPVTLIDGLEHPWGMDWLPNGDMLITERAGRLRLVRDGALVDTPIDGVPDVLAFGQGGLLDVAVHPYFVETGWVYFTYASGSRDANRTTVARAQFDGRRLSDVEPVFQVSDPKNAGQHFGSRLLWLPDGTLLASIGDGGNPPISFDRMEIRQQAQNPGTHFGSIVRIAADGSTPADNPMVGDDGALPEIWSYGHRNIQGLGRDPVTGAIWANDHGALAGDEAYPVAPGDNHGWPAVTYSRNYGSGSLITPHLSLPDMVDPAIVWMTTKAPSGLAVYRGTVFAAWDGDVLSGGLVTRDIRRLDLDEAGIIQGETSIAIGQRVRDVAVGPDGHVYVLTDEPDGALIRLDPS